ncbi:MAG: hypothetical protein V4628_09630 [Pseudomonadota bacterium]
MTKIVDIESRRIQKEHDRKDARAKAMQDSFRKVRQDQKSSPENRPQATTKLLALFKTKAPQKPSPPTGKK